MAEPAPEAIPGGEWEWHCRRPDCPFWCFEPDDAATHYRTTHQADDEAREAQRIFREMHDDPFGGLFEINARLGYGPDI